MIIPKEETVFMVSGFMRTGTSMMMKALEAGGLEAVRQDSRDEFRLRHADQYYDPNEGGLYELEREDYQVIGFPRQFKGKLIKCLIGGSNISTVPKLKIILMRRDYEEIRQSYMAFFGQILQIDEESLLQRFEIAIDGFKNRRDTELDVLWYRDVINKPQEVFESLASNGWPIDPTRAASVVNPELLRYKKEELEVGII